MYSFRITKHHTCPDAISSPNLRRIPYQPGLIQGRKHISRDLVEQAQGQLFVKQVIPIAVLRMIWRRQVYITL